MKTLLRVLLLIIAVSALALAIDQITPLKRFTTYLAQHPEPYRGITVGSAVAGWALLIGAFTLLGLSGRGRRMSEEEAREFMRTSAGRPGVVGAFRGRAVGREFRGEATFREIKDAIRLGTWLRDKSLWPILLGLLGTGLAAYGMFGYFFVVGPPLVKLLCGVTLIYATARTGWGFWKA